MEERNVGTKGKSPKQDLTSAQDVTIELAEDLKIELAEDLTIELAEDLTIELAEGRESFYHRLD